MSLPHTFQVIGSIMANANTAGGGGGGGGGGGPVNLPEYNDEFVDYDVVLNSSGFAPDGAGFTPWAATSIILRTDGTGTYRMSNVNTGDTDYNFTWLNSGTNSDYFAYMVKTGGDGDFDEFSSATSTPLQLSSFRSWQLYLELPTLNSYESKFIECTLSIRDSSDNVLTSIDVLMLVIVTNGTLE